MRPAQVLAEKHSALLQRIQTQFPEINRNLATCGYAIWRDDDTIELAQNARAEYTAALPALPLHPQAEKFKPAHLQQAPWRKLAIGATNGLGNPYAQFLMTSYFPERSARFPHLTALFATLVRLRNALTGMHEDFGYDAAQDGFWNACRIHHYPRGGGFMAEHKDTHFPKVLEGKGVPFLQVMAVLSTIGDDFNCGGGFMRDKRGALVRTDMPGSFGSVIFFDGAIDHGVDTVDPDVLPNFESVTGRIAAFVNLYEVL